MATAYRFCELLGHGGMGEVYLAIQEGFGGFEKLIVIKRMAPMTRRDGMLTSLFAREARLAACIRHPNVVQVLDIQRTGRELFIMMEYISGLTFRDVSEEGPVPPGVAAKALADAAAGLAAGHQATVRGVPQAIVHGDVSPPNLMLRFDGRASVLDFGIAHVARSHDAPDTESAMCKMAYVAPEQIQGGSVGPWTDAWQLGVVAHELLTGRHPFPLEPQRADRVCAGPPPSLRTVQPGIPAEMDDLVRSLLSARPAERPTCPEVHQRFGDWALRWAGVPDGGAAQWMQQNFREAHRTQQALEAGALGQTLDSSRFDYLTRLFQNGSAARVGLDGLSEPPPTADGSGAHSGAGRKGREPGVWVQALAALVALTVGGVLGARPWGLDRGSPESVRSSMVSASSSPFADGAPAGAEADRPASPPPGTQRPSGPSAKPKFGPAEAEPAESVPTRARWTELGRTGSKPTPVSRSRRSRDRAPAPSTPPPEAAPPAETVAPKREASDSPWLPQTDNIDPWADPSGS